MLSRVQVWLTRLMVLAIVSGVAIVVVPATASANSTQSALVQFFVCPDNDCAGIHVSIEPAAKYFNPSQDYSNCTRDETDINVPVTQNGVVMPVSALFKNSGSCFAERAHNTWLVKTWKDKQMLARGLLALQEDDPFLANYYATCDPRSSPWSPVWTATKLDCHKQDTTFLQVSTPGAGPKWPDCPSSGAYCYVNISLSASANPAEGLVPCGSFSISSQTCQGTSFGTRGWTVPELRPRSGIGTYFSYKTQGSSRDVQYDAKQAATIVQAEIVGSVPTSADALSVSDAFSRASPALHFKTGTTAPPGAPGGPLYFNYDSKFLSTTVVIVGYLTKK